MNLRHAAVVAVVVMVLFAGCSAIDGSSDDESPTDAETNDTVDDTESNESDDDRESEGETNDTDEGADQDESDGTDDTDDSEDSDDTADSDDGDDTDDADGGDDTADSDDGDDADDSTDDGNEDTTAEQSWSPPQEPNRPMEDDREDRIHSVRFVDKEPANGSDGYSNFNLEVVADTRMENIDPPEHGDVVGEPYFFVKINEEEDKIVERTSEVRMEENGTFHIPVRPAGIEEYGERQLTVEVFLMDQDKDWDDILASWGGTIHYNPDAGAGGEAE